MLALTFVYFAASTFAEEASVQRVDLSGSGSHWPGALYDQVTYAFNAQSDESDQAEYLMTSVSSGKEELLAGDIDFVGADGRNAACGDDRNCTESLKYYPSVAGAVVPIYFLPVDTLNETIALSLTMLFQIFTGEVTRWNDPDLAALLEVDASLLPDEEIRVVVIGEDTTTTDIFVEALSMNPRFSKFNAENGVPYWCGRGIESISMEWHVGRQVTCMDDEGGWWNYTEVSSTDEMISLIEDTPGSLGYVDYGSVAVAEMLDGFADRRFKVADMFNRAAEKVQISTTAIEFAMMELSGQFDDNDVVSLVEAVGKEVWPMSGYTYFVIRATPPPAGMGRKGAFKCDRRQVLLDYMSFFYNRASSSLAQDLGFATLPQFMRTIMEDRMKAEVKCENGTLAAEGVEASNVEGSIVVPVDAYEIVKLYADAYTVAEDLEFSAWPVFNVSNSRQVATRHERHRDVAFAVTSFDQSPIDQYGPEWIDEFWMSPLYLTGVAVVYRLDAATNGTVVLDANVLAQIYLGEITMWSDDRIKSLQTTEAFAESLPDIPILPVSRVEDTDDVSVVKRVLSETNETFRNVFSNTTGMIALDPNFFGMLDDDLQGGLDDDLVAVGDDAERSCEDICSDGAPTENFGGDEGGDDVQNFTSSSDFNYTACVEECMSSLVGAASDPGQQANATESITWEEGWADSTFFAGGAPRVANIVRAYDGAIGFVPYTSRIDLAMARMRTYDAAGEIIDDVELTTGSLRACVSASSSVADFCYDYGENYLFQTYSLWSEEEERCQNMSPDTTGDEEQRLRGRRLNAPTDDGLGASCWPLTATYDASISKKVVDSICNDTSTPTVKPERRLVEFMRWVMAGGDLVDDALVSRCLVPVSNEDLGRDEESDPRTVLTELLAEQIQCSEDLEDLPDTEDDDLTTRIEVLVAVLVSCVLLLALTCVVWLSRYKNTLIVSLSQPVYLVVMCCGCVISTSSALSIFFRGDVSCQWQIFLYGCGFAITTGTLVTKMYSMERSISSSLKFRMTEPKQARRELATDALIVMGVMMAGELAILLGWLFSSSPLEWREQCIDDMETITGQTHCLESSTKCRSDLTVPFLGALFSYHLVCLGIGIWMCYRVRNIPSILAEGKWVFTAVYSQIQLIVIALPLLALVEKDYQAFTVLKTALICASDMSVLLMIFIPKFQLVWKYGDFDRDKVISYINSTVHFSTQNDHIYQGLRKSEASDTSGGVHDMTKRSFMISGLSIVDRGGSKYRGSSGRNSEDDANRPSSCATDPDQTPSDEKRAFFSPRPPRRKSENSVSRAAHDEEIGAFPGSDMHGNNRLSNATVHVEREETKTPSTSSSEEIDTKEKEGVSTY